MTAPTLGWFRAPTAADAGTLNVCYSALDRPVITGRSDDLVMHGPEPRTFATLLENVAAFAGALAGLGIVPGAVALIDLADDLDAVVARLACARVGAVSVSGDLTTLLDILHPPLVVSSRPGDLAAVLARSTHQPTVCILREAAGLDPLRDVDWDLAVKAGRTDPAGCAEVPAAAPYSFVRADSGVLQPRTTLEKARQLAALTTSPVSIAELRAALED